MALSIKAYGWTSASGIYARNKTSYLDSADVQTDTFSDETAGPGEADKTLGEAACGSDKSPGPSVCSSQSER